MIKDKIMDDLKSEDDFDEVLSKSLNFLRKAKPTSNDFHAILGMIYVTDRNKQIEEEAFLSHKNINFLYELVDKGSIAKYYHCSDCQSFVLEINKSSEKIYFSEDYKFCDEKTIKDILD